MFTRILHSLAARPHLYNALQSAVGAQRVRALLAEHLRELPRGGVVLDVGGGTGLFAPLAPAGAHYICLDVDMEKLSGFRTARPGGMAVAGDAQRLPMADASIDAVVCTNVSHHLPQPVLDGFLAEAARVLRPQGVLLFADAVWKPCRLPSRLVWYYDRGDFPRKSADLRSAVERVLRVRRWEKVRLLHEYVVCTAGH